MYRYFVFSWDAASPQQASIAAALADKLTSEGLSATGGWTQAIASRGLLAFHSGRRRQASDAYVLMPTTGVIFGKLFRRKDYVGVTHGTVPDFLSQRIRDTRGGHLLSDYWGRYVAFLVDSDGLHVLRDPSGNFPCLFAEHAGVRLIFSDLADCVKLDVIRFTVNWNFIAEHSYQRPQHLAETGLNEVSELYAGERLSLIAGRLRRSLCWDPLKIARESPLNDVEVATTELRRAIRGSVEGWAACYRGILHTLSGGLDSSIVAACLKEAHSQPHITCVNYVTRDREGDERVFARLMAAQSGFPLIEVERDPAAVDLRAILNIAPSAKPGVYRYTAEHSRQEAALAARHHATAIFSGGGGDQLFYQTGAEFAAIDDVWMHGLRPRIGRIAWDAARVQGQAIWRVLYRALRDLYRPAAWEPFADTTQCSTLLSDAAHDARINWKELQHPWFARTQGVAPGKLWHALMLSIPANFYDPLGKPEDPERVHPLFSQPVMEICLRIPSAIFISCGWDRAIARRAFAPDLPRRIALRRSKASIGDHARHLFLANAAFVQPLLQDGQLLAHGILDRGRLEKFFAAQSSVTGDAFAEIQDYLSTEAWLRLWS